MQAIGMSLKNKYPVYIVSKGRAESRLTVKALTRCKVDFKVVVEEAEYEQYNKHIGAGKLLILPEKYKLEYELCDALGFSRSTGPGPARNFCLGSCHGTWI